MYAISHHFTHSWPHECASGQMQALYCKALSLETGYLFGVGMILRYRVAACQVRQGDRMLSIGADYLIDLNIQQFLHVRIVQVYLRKYWWSWSFDTWGQESIEAGWQGTRLWGILLDCVGQNILFVSHWMDVTRQCSAWRKTPGNPEVGSSTVPLMCWGMIEDTLDNEHPTIFAVRVTSSVNVWHCGGCNRGSIRVVTNWSM